MTRKQIQQVRKKVEDNIKNDGFNVTYVSAGASPSFCYSTGVYKTYGVPEVFISSLPPNLSQELVTSYVDKYKGASGVPTGKRITDLTSRFPVYLLKISNSLLSDYALASSRFYQNEHYEYVQLVYPDTDGHFPDEPGYDYDQVILGEFSS